MEVPFRRDVDARRLVPCAVAAAASYITRWWLIGPRHLVVMSGRPTIDLSFVADIALVALACGIGARLFASVDEWLHEHAQHHTRLGRALAAGLVLAAITWAGHALSHEWVTFGPGYIAVDWLFSGSHPRWAIAGVLLVRAAATLSCRAVALNMGLWRRADSTRRQSRQMKKHFLQEKICKPKLISPAQEYSCSLPLPYPTLPE
jgi:H+/Cl- antiporter ClcA